MVISLTLPHFMALPTDPELTHLIKHMDHPLVQDSVTRSIKKLILHDVVKMKIKIHDEFIYLDHSKNKFLSVTAYTTTNAKDKRWFCHHIVDRVKYPQLPCALLEFFGFRKTRVYIVPLEDIIVEAHPEDEKATEFFQHAFTILNLPSIRCTQ